MEVVNVKLKSLLCLFVLLAIIGVGSGVSFAVGTYAECTCGANSYGCWHEVEFVNYCPLCGCSGYLGVFPMYDGVDTEISCLNCGADYCSFDGWDKSGRYRARLTVYVPEPEPVVAENATSEPAPLEGWDLAHHVYRSNEILCIG